MPFEMFDYAWENQLNQTSLKKKANKTIGNAFAYKETYSESNTDWFTFLRSFDFLTIDYTENSVILL